ncbi:MAG: HAMP domain-containing sensor histidine kinase [Pseudomonadota bacterium]
MLKQNHGDASLKSAQTAAPTVSSAGAVESSGRADDAQRVGAGVFRRALTGSSSAIKNRASSLGLSTKLLIFTLAAVLLAEVLIFVPSIANFRRTWLLDRLGDAQIASTAALAAPEGVLPAKLRDELLMGVGVLQIAVRQERERRLIMAQPELPPVATLYDLRTASTFELIGDALAVMVRSGERTIAVRGTLPWGSAKFIEIVLDERPLREAMLAFGVRIFWLSIIISLIVAGLVFLALNALMVRPIKRITENMVVFAEAPEDASRRLEPMPRGDEIGRAARELEAMQTQLQHLLKQKERLAQLGLAVSKINHDLRNMLAHAQLISDRFADSSDPTVQRFAPKLINSLDRAIRLCTETLRYGEAREAPPAKADVPLAVLVDEVADTVGLGNEDCAIAWTNAVDRGLVVHADRDQLYRVIANVVRNAREVLETLPAAPAPADGQEAGPGLREIAVSAAQDGAGWTICVSDNGPGVPPPARKALFQAFRGSVRPGGTGLGLSIASELIRAHGGQITLIGAEQTGSDTNGRTGGHPTNHANNSGHMGNGEAGSRTPAPSQRGLKPLCGATFHITLPAHQSSSASSGST